MRENYDIQNSILIELSKENNIITEEEYTTLIIVVSILLTALIVIIGVALKKYLSIKEDE